MDISKDQDRVFMNMALKKAIEGILRGQSPFGACIIREGEVVSCAHNAVWAFKDPTAHAEVCAIRRACEKLQTISLEGCVLYSTCEPCPMCFSASHWAKISRIVYGASIQDALSVGFNELRISNETLKKQGGSRIEIVRGVMQEECVKLLTTWSHKENSKAKLY
jgi:tRNA(Arg) A34 adenosine deaminase TadA